jgi:hypothetical protein
MRRQKIGSRTWLWTGRAIIPNFERSLRISCSVEIQKDYLPTIQKPQLDRTSFPWQDQSDRFHTDLEAQRAQILGRSGFDREFGNSGDVASTNAEREGAEFILELSGILSQAAAIKMDSGFKATNKVVATLKSIKKDPALILKGGVEPEALAMVASNYQRGDEKPGTYWFDVDRSDDVPFPAPQRVSEAASVAIDKLSARRGQPNNIMLDFLGDKLLACYLRFNLTAGRRPVAVDGDGSQLEAGPFLEFLSTVIAPLNRFLIQLPACYGAKVVSAPELARRALRRRGKSRIGRIKKFDLGLFRISPNSSHN